MQLPSQLPKVQKNLNPSLWSEDQKLKPEVRQKLTLIAEDFYQYCDVEFPILDVVITGSMANYNWYQGSDLDLHLITDYKQIDCDQELDELFDTKRRLYEREHQIKIYGIPVTLYVEDVNQPGVSRGLYSVWDNQWLRQPGKVTWSVDQKQFTQDLKMWMTLIRETKKNKNLASINNLLKLIRLYRRLALKQPQGEFSTANLVYKTLRTQGELDHLQDLANQLKGQALSLPH